MSETALFIIGISLFLYFIPSIIAAMHERRNKVAIIALNFLLGWTFLGWVAALCWALINDVELRAGGK